MKKQKGIKQLAHKTIATTNMTSQDRQHNHKAVHPQQHIKQKTKVNPCRD